MSFLFFKKKSCDTLYDKWRELCRSNRSSIKKQNDTKQLESQLKTIKLSHNVDTALTTLDQWLGKRSASSSSRYQPGLQLKKFILEKKNQSITETHQLDLKNLAQKYNINQSNPSPIVRGKFHAIAALPSFTFAQFKTWLETFKENVAYATSQNISTEEVQELERQLNQLQYGLNLKLKTKTSDFFNVKNILEPYKQLIHDLKDIHITQYQKHRLDIANNQQEIAQVEKTLAMLSPTKSRKSLNALLCMPLTNLMVDFDFAFDAMVEFGNLTTLFT